MIAEVTPDRREGLFDRIALELQRSVDNFERQSGGMFPACGSPAAS